MSFVRIKKIFCLGFFLFMPLLALAQSSTCIPDGGTRHYIECSSANCCEGLVCEAKSEWVTYQSPTTGSVMNNEKYVLCRKPNAGELSNQNGNTSVSEDKPVVFKPQVTIPGSIFTAQKEIVIDAETTAKYLSYFFNFFTGAIVVMAVVMIMWGGFKRIAAAGSSETIKGANDTIISAISGLVLVLITYTLLKLINPSLVNIKDLSAVNKIDRETFSYESEEQLLSQKAPSTTNLLADDGLKIQTTEAGLDNDTRISLLNAWGQLLSRGYGMVVTSAYRDPAKQQSLINLNCPKGATKSGQCSPPTCLMLNGPNSCPHTTGHAVDIWASKSGTICISAPAGKTRVGYCSGSGKQECFNNECQKALIEEMKKQGFCVLQSEPWHFEKPKLSSSCN